MTKLCTPGIKSRASVNKPSVPLWCFPSQQFRSTGIWAGSPVSLEMTSPHLLYAKMILHSNTVRRWRHSFTMSSSSQNHLGSPGMSSTNVPHTSFHKFWPTRFDSSCSVSDEVGSNTQGNLTLRSLFVHVKSKPASCSQPGTSIQGFEQRKSLSKLVESLSSIHIRIKGPATFRIGAASITRSSSRPPGARSL